MNNERINVNGKMKRAVCYLNVIFLLDSVLGVLLPPSNLSVNSVNFLHILHWDPGPATPPGVQYKVFERLSGKLVEQSRNDCNITTATSLQLKLDKYNKYYLSVQALYNGTSSSHSQEVVFTPFEQTIIGPPIVIMTECDNCIQMNISLPKAHQSSGILNNDILAFYKPKFRVLWKQDDKLKIYTTENSITLYNLEEGKTYCVQIETEITMNKNTEPSTWKCITSTAKLNKVPVFLSGAACLLIFIISALTLIYCFYYTGFFCKLQATLPRALNVSKPFDVQMSAPRYGKIQVGVINAKSLPIVETSPDLISIGSNTHKQKKHTITAALCAAHKTTYSGMEEVDEEEDNEETNGYIDRDGDFFSGEVSCQKHCDISKTCLTVKYHPETDASHSSTENVPARLDPLETAVENKDTFLGCRPEIEDKEQFIFQLAEEMNESAVSMSKNVDLWTVTLPDNDICENERNTEDSLMALRVPHQESVMSSVTKHMCQIDRDDLPSMMWGECNSIDVRTQETLEEKQCSDYMGR
ncbi:uncharacterized protein LOC144086774 isoform X2 [Stigmatopora argus]